MCVIQKILFDITYLENNKVNVFIIQTKKLDNFLFMGIYRKDPCTDFICRNEKNLSS